MNSYDDGFPDEAFTDLERDAGVPGIIRGGARQHHARSLGTAKVTESDCIALIVRSLVMQDLNEFSLRVVHPGADGGVDYSFKNLRGLNSSTVDQTEFSIVVDGHRFSIRTLLNALRNIGLPLFMEDTHRPWLAWDQASQTLVTNLEYQGGHLKRCFWPEGLERAVTVPTDPERARVFKLLRTAYLSSDHGKKPIVVHNSRLADALEKRPVPFEEPKTISKAEVDEFSLVYFTHSGEVSTIPLSKAYTENVTVSTRAGTYFHARGWGLLRPSLNENVLWANSFRMSVENNPSRFCYYLRRKRGTVFQSVFEQIDIPSHMQYWHSSLDDVESRSKQISEWADERNAMVYLTANGHPLQSNDCESVTTPEHYARAVRKLHECGFEINNSSGDDDVAVIWTRANELARHSEGPYAQPWKPAGQ